MNIMIKTTLITTLLLATALSSLNTISTNAQNRGTDQLAAKYCTSNKKDFETLKSFDKATVDSINANVDRYRTTLKNENRDIQIHTAQYNKAAARLETQANNIQKIVNEYNKKNKVKIELDKFDIASDYKQINNKLKQRKILSGGFTTVTDGSSIGDLDKLIKVELDTYNVILDKVFTHLFNAENVVHNNLVKKHRIYIAKFNRNIQLEKIKECKERLETVQEPKSPSKKFFNKKTRKISIKQNNKVNLLSAVKANRIVS